MGKIDTAEDLTKLLDWLCFKDVELDWFDELIFTEEDEEDIEQDSFDFEK